MTDSYDDGTQHPEAPQPAPADAGGDPMPVVEATLPGDDDEHPEAPQPAPTDGQS